MTENDEVQIKVRCSASLLEKYEGFKDYYLQVIESNEAKRTTGGRLLLELCKEDHDDSDEYDRL